MALPDIEYSRFTPEQNLINATARGDMKAVKKLADAGVDMNYSSNQLENSLTIAAQHQGEKMVQLLLENGADPNVPKLKSTPLILSIAKKDIKKIEMLLKHNANPNLDNGIYTPLTASIVSGQMDVFELLIKAGADINAGVKNKFNPAYEMSPLKVASGSNSEIVKRLLELGAIHDVEGINETPLMNAALHNNFRCVKVIIDHGVNVNAVNPQKDTALHFACKSGAIDCVKILLEITDISIKNTFDQTALDLAKSQSKANPELIALVEDFVLKQSIKSNNEPTTTIDSPARRRL